MDNWALSQLENLSVTTRNSNAQHSQTRPPHISMESSSSSTVGWNNLQEHQLNSSPIVSYRVGILEEDGSQHRAGAAGMMVYVGPELPWLPQQLVDKMLAGDYVDFNELPLARGISKPGMQFTMECLVSRVHATDQSLIFVLGHSASCFIQQSWCPDKLRKRLALLPTCLEQLKWYKWPSWVVYDQNFRQEMARKPQESWAKVDSRIYSRSFLGMDCSAGGWCEQRLSFDHETEECPLGPAPKQSR